MRLVRLLKKPAKKEMERILVGIEDCLNFTLNFLRFSLQGQKNLAGMTVTLPGASDSARWYALSAYSTGADPG